MARLWHVLGSWDKEIDFEGDPRSGAVSFVINGYAYVGTGYNNAHQIHG